nr:hypothetical protein [Tanacetum cinerariifolium]
MLCNPELHLKREAAQSAYEVSKEKDRTGAGVVMGPVVGCGRGGGGGGADGRGLASSQNSSSCPILRFQESYALGSAVATDGYMVIEEEPTVLDAQIGSTVEDLKCDGLF